MAGKALETITACYNKSPWFDHYRDELEKVYSIKIDFLLDFNLHCFYWLADKMSIKTPVSLSDNYIQLEDPDNVEDLRNHLMPSTINKIYPQPEPYPQVFEERCGFIPNLSILDYLFCVGSGEWRVGSGEY